MGAAKQETEKARKQLEIAEAKERELSAMSAIAKVREAAVEAKARIAKTLDKGSQEEERT